MSISEISAIADTSITLSDQALLASSAKTALADAEALTAATTASAVAAAAIVNAATASAARTAAATIPPDPLTQDMTALLKTLLTGDTVGAQSDLAKLKTDLKAQEAAIPPPALKQDLTALVGAVKSGDAPSIDAATSRVGTDLSALAATAFENANSPIPLNALVTQVSTDLNTGSLSGAVQDVASFLVQSGHTSGNLIDTTA